MSVDYIEALSRFDLGNNPSSQARPRLVLASSRRIRSELLVRLGKQIADKRESLPYANSSSLSGRGASNTPCPEQAASSTAA
jgi:hypothetical protein